MSTEIAVVNTAPITPAPVVEEPTNDNGNWGDEVETRPGFIRLKQPTSENLDHVQNGHFVHAESGQTWSEVQMVILSMHKTRAWKPSSPKFVAGEKAVCKSYNGKFPILNNENLIPQAESCDKCSKSSWDGYNKKTKEGVKPTCDKGFFILFIDKETNLPYIYMASGKGVSAAEKMFTAVYERSKIVRSKTGRMPNTYDYVVTMTSEKDGKYFKPKFTKFAQLTAEEAEAFGPLYEQFVKSRSATKVIEGETQEAEAEYIEDTGAVDDDTPAAI